MTRTKRRRFLWCAWWTGEPSREPFRAPDAWSGGARSLEEAHAAADSAAGMHLHPVDGHWAAGWLRVRAGLPPFAVPRPARTTAADAPAATGPHALLGVPVNAPLAVVKEAFRRRALIHHPDRGGDPAAFVALRRAYDRVMSRRRSR